jgi:hypothetical protein
MSKNTSLGAYGIMYVVINRKSEVLSLLSKNGVKVPSNASDMTIALAVTNLLKVSKSFYNEFSKLLINEDVIYGLSANMTGSYSNMSGSYANLTGDSAFCMDKKNKTLFPSSYKSACEGSSSTFDPSVFTTGTKDTKTKDTKSTSSNTGWINKGLDLLQTGFQGYLQLDDNKTKRELADASVKISNDELTKKEDAPPPKGLSTGAIVGISLLGVTVVGLVIYLISKKKSNGV